jgi:hypothetical protein
MDHRLRACSVWPPPDSSPSRVRLGPPAGRLPSTRPPADFPGPRVGTPHDTEQRAHGQGRAESESRTEIVPGPAVHRHLASPAALPAEISSYSHSTRRTERAALVSTSAITRGGSGLPSAVVALGVARRITLARRGQECPSCSISTATVRNPRSAASPRSGGEIPVLFGLHISSSEILSAPPPARRSRYELPVGGFARRLISAIRTAASNSSRKRSGVGTRALPTSTANRSRPGADASTSAMRCFMSVS